MAIEPTADTIVQACIDRLAKSEARWESIPERWFASLDFSGYGSVVVQPFAENCAIAGAVLQRSFCDTSAAIDCWRRGRLAFRGIELALSARSHHRPEAVPPESEFGARSLLYLQHCVWLGGDRSGVERVRALFDSPYISLLDADGKAVDPMGAESRVRSAAHEGDVALVEELVKPLLKHYGRYKLDPIYVEVWRSISVRDDDRLDAALPVAVQAYKKSARRQNNDIWGGSRPYNTSMIDLYMTMALKMARSVGMKWAYRSSETDQLWPGSVIDHWQKDSA